MNKRREREITDEVIREFAPELAKSMNISIVEATRRLQRFVQKREQRHAGMSEAEIAEEHAVSDEMIREADGFGMSLGDYMQMIRRTRGGGTA